MAEHFRYFGYGSLVNRGTLPAGTEAVPAVLVGFRRGWRSAAAAGESGYCSLSIEPCEGGRIAGLLASERVEALGRLDERERRYHRLTLPGDRLEMADNHAPPAIFYTYRAMARHNQFGTFASPATLSYLDTVLQGYLREFGEAGLHDFISTTDGWDIVPFLDDRDAPRYQRAQPVSAAERALFDRLLAGVGVHPLRAADAGVPGPEGTTDMRGPRAADAERALSATRAGSARQVASAESAERLHEATGGRQQAGPEARPRSSSPSRASSMRSTGSTSPSRMQQRAENDADL